ncbi:MAG: hypothetical protein WC869_02335 [Phycisphaerae bacterium]|jgi:hypothetical protein
MKGVKKLRAVLNEHKWSAFWGILAPYAIFNLIPFMFGAVRNNPLCIILSLIIVSILVTLVILVVAERLAVSAEAEKHLQTLRKEVLHTAHIGANPAIANIALLSSCNFTQSKGVIVELCQYMRLLKESANYEDLRDVTFIARVEPSDWGTQNDGGAAGLAWQYLDALAKIKATNKNIRMRRILLLEDEVYRAEQQKPTYSAFCDAHLKAKIDLIHLTPNHIPVSLCKDLAVFVGPDGDRRGWIVKSTYDYHKPTEENTPIEVWLECRESDSINSLPNLFGIITQIYRHIDSEGGPGTFCVHVKQAGWGNAPDEAYLHSAGVLT